MYIKYGKSAAFLAQTEEGLRGGDEDSHPKVCTVSSESRQPVTALECRVIHR